MAAALLLPVASEPKVVLVMPCAEAGSVCFKLASELPSPLMANTLVRVTVTNSDDPQRATIDF